MNRLLRWTLRLYPRSWRDRYGAELEALLEDKGATYVDLPDLLRGALTLRLKTNAPLLLFAAAGLCLGLAMHSWAAPDYRATVTGPHSGSTEAIQARAKDLMRNPSLHLFVQTYNLYREPRENHPLEEVLEQMRRDISIAKTSDNQVAVSFRYPDRLIAIDVARDLAIELGLKPQAEPVAMKHYKTWLLIPFGLLLGLGLGWVIPKYVRLR